MEILTKLISFLILIKFLILLCKLHSAIEKKFIKKGPNIIAVSFDTWSLKVFNKVKCVLLCIGSFEAIWFGIFEMKIFLAGISLFIFGSILRYIAIYTLGCYWNYNIVLYENHKIVQKGIYRYIHHPGYIGNVYLVGIFLCLNSTVTATITILFTTIFYLYRTKIENELFNSRRSHYGKLDILPRHIKQGI
jgi:isoprenylcysteine carboxyl methyltransferase (ICMT) family protein YpbQ